ncbi:hypothetical protein [Mesorhizobium sp. M1A.F.Ca.IN.022.04.1.1]|nr:hypothetical protein [Mesorhizobium sp. M1A.F.Ca.IN.022.04.1.1]
MKARPSNSRERGCHSLGKALSAGLLIAAIAFVIFAACGGLVHK